MQLVNFLSATRIHEEEEEEENDEEEEEDERGYLMLVFASSGLKVLVPQINDLLCLTFIRV